MRILFLAMAIFLISGECLYSQLYENQYRPPGQNWQELRTDHFRIIYPAEARHVAERSAHILEREYPHVRKTIGGRLNRFPVILNTDNDRGGGFVSPMPFRSEVETAARRGKGVNPRSGGWLEHVLPHELVHALHMNVNPGSASSLVGLLSPDIRRGIHTAVPIGMFEGIAVHYESHGTPYGGGRGHLPWFTGQSSALIDGSDRWSMGQLFHRPGATLPADRHYIGSYQFTDWLLETYGEETMKEAIRIHFIYPILGFGYALRQATGEWPSTLHRQFREERTQDSNERERSALHRPKFLPLNSAKKGVRIRRPLWLSEDRILFHGTFSNAPTGFWLFHTEESTSQLLREQRVTQDMAYTLDKNGVVWFSDYVVDGRYDNRSHTDLFVWDPEADESERITERGRVYFPSPGPDTLALRTDHDRQQLVRIGDPVRTLTERDRNSSVEEVVQHPSGSGLTAYVMRVENIQGVWIQTEEDREPDLDRLPDLFFDDGSIFDLSWHPDKANLLFSSDRDGTLDLYELDIHKQQVYRLTDEPSNIHEPSYSPDGSKLAMVVQKGGEHFPAVAERDRQLDRTVPDEYWKPDQNRFDSALGPEIDRNVPDRENWTHSPYRSGLDWLRPRTLIPETERYDGGFRSWGLALHSTDVLSRHSYSVSGSWMEQRPWFDFDYRYSGVWPGFGISLYNRPTTFFLNRGNIATGESIHILARRSGGSIYVPFQYTFRDGPRHTRLLLRPVYRFSKLRLLRSGIPEEDFFTGQSEYLQDIGLNLSFGYRLRQFRKDVQPNAGWILNAGGEMTIWTRSDEDPPLNFQFADQRGLNVTLYRFLSPFPHWNQSLRIGLRYLNQTRFGPYRRQSLFSDLFAGDIHTGSNRLASLQTRYTIPLIYPDRGGLTIPAYLESVYLVLMSDSAAALDRGGVGEGIGNARTVLGSGIRFRTRIGNLSMDLGIGFSYELSRDQWNAFFGPF